MNKLINWLLLQIIWWSDKDLRERNRRAKLSIEIMKRQK